MGRTLSLIMCFFISVQCLKAQLPILYYDFENNSNRSNYESTVELAVNTGNSAITATGTSSLSGAAGAGLTYVAGVANGESIVSTGWATTSSDPGTSASSYYQLTANTSGFSGLSLDFDYYNTSLLNLGVLFTGPKSIGILYSTDGGTTFFTTTTQASTTYDTWAHLSFDLSSYTAINNKSSVILRIYGYNAKTLIVGEPFRMDNLQIKSLSTVAGAGTKTMISESSIYTCITSGATGSSFSRQSFTVDGASTIINISQETFTGSGTTAGNLAVKNSGTLNITADLTIDSAIVATSTPASTLDINSSGIVNLSGGNLLCKGNTTVSSTGTFNCGTYLITNAGNFTVSSGGTLGIGSTVGISSSGATGNVQSTGRSFSSSGNYTYNGSANQVTGAGLPSSINNFTINNSSGNVSLTNDLTVSGQTTLTVGSLVIGNKTLTLNGALVRTSGYLNGTSNSMLSLGGSSSQDISFDSKDSLSTLTINKTSGTTATLNTALNIFTGVVFNASNLGNLDLNNKNLILKSSATATAYLGRIYGNLNNATNVTIERYVAAHRAWRMMAVPIMNASAPTINACWQEGGIVSTPGNIVDPSPGYGTHITGGPSSQGFDRNYVNNPSLKVFDTTTKSWKNVTNTTSTLITANAAYMLFVRGSRAVILNMNQYALADNTILRTTGTPITGTQTFNAYSPGFRFFSNPYASTINFKTITKSGTADTYYLWDPLLTGNNGVGAFVTLTRFGSNYIAAPTPLSPIDLTGSIESGAGFFVNFATAGSIQINESDKTTGSAMVFRPEPAYQNELLRANLYELNDDSSVTRVDGVVTAYDKSFSNDVTTADAAKITNINENISILRSGKSLAIEMRRTIAMNDTTFFKIGRLTKRNYRLEFISNIEHPGLTALLIDNYLHTQTALNLTNATLLDFSVNADSASAASDRFKIIFTTNRNKIIVSDFGSENIVYPNPVVNHKMTLNLKGKLQGRYNVIITDQSGEIVFTKRIEYSGGNEMLKLPSSISGNIYQLQVVGPENKKIINNLLLR